jgi:hypothetical protein
VGAGSQILKGENEFGKFLESKRQRETRVNNTLLRRQPTPLCYRRRASCKLPLHFCAGRLPEIGLPAIRGNRAQAKRPRPPLGTLKYQTQTQQQNARRKTELCVYMSCACARLFSYAACRAPKCRAVSRRAIKDPCGALLRETLAQQNQHRRHLADILKQT